MKATQYFTREYLEHTRRLSPIEIVEFLENFRLMHERPGKSKLISLKVPENLLALFKNRCQAQGLRYQTQIKRLMSEWIEVGK